MTLAIGSRLGPYEILAPTSAGGEESTVPPITLLLDHSAALRKSPGTR